ncbi:MAG: caspase family protein [Rhodobacteraceae bacterium]|nr:caspase family protein [Paracoccaceae bacterium]MCY4141365.1 caspase family protein [Paracoccaceae bacterium]
MRQSTTATIASLMFAFGQSCPAGDIYGLVIGVNDYTHIEPLRGAVNDALDISGALEDLSARDVRVLLDGEATREAIFRHFNALAEQAGEGDTLILHFAGHGARQEAILKGHEEKDNAFLLSGFAPDGPAVSHRIVDNEIGHLLATEEEAVVVFAADTCFAGDMLRNADGRAEIAVRSPLTDIGETGDLVAERVRQLGEVDDNSLRHVIWLYAQDANRLTPEIPIDGRLRGALSHAFGLALRGEADSDQDRMLSIGELKRFVNKNVRERSRRLQRSEVNAGSPDLSINLTGGSGAQAQNVEIPELRIFYMDGAKIEVAGAGMGFRGVIEVQDKGQADIILDNSGSTDWIMIYKTGDVVAIFPSSLGLPGIRERIQGAIDKWRLIEMFPRLGSPEDPELSLGDGDRTYFLGEVVEFLIRSEHHRHVVLFNLANDGTVQLVAPTESGGNDLFSGRLTPGQRTRFSAPVMPPFGADNLVAITTPREFTDLRQLISALNGQRSASVLAEELSRLLPTTGFGMESVGLFTQAR